jgi:hypothetical protein
MRVAVLMTGQMRRWTDPDVLQSIQRFFGLFGPIDTVDIFVSTWSDRGVSYNHGDVKLRGDEGDIVTAEAIRSVYPQVRGVAVRDRKEWEGTLQGVWKSVYTEGFEWNGMTIKGTVVPQLFGIWDANRMRKEYARTTGTTYDLVIRCRPDVVFRDFTRSLYESCVSNTIYAINNKASGTYYPQRIYDIFFYGSEAAMDVVCEAYEVLDKLVAHPWQNGLHPRDACRCLYVQARFVGGLAVQDILADVCAVKR